MLKKRKRILGAGVGAVLFLALILQFIAPLAHADANTLATVTWTPNGESAITINIKKNDSGYGTGYSWTCNSAGGFSISFYRSGSVKLTSGNMTGCNATVVGGGGGGSSAWAQKNANDSWNRTGTGYGGNGGKGGDVTSQSVTVTKNTAVSVVIGGGGTGGTPSSEGPAANVSQTGGSNGGTSSFGSVTASGGGYNAGGYGCNPGQNGNGAGGDAASGSRSGGGGGSVSAFDETNHGNWRKDADRGYSCFICGADIVDGSYNGVWYYINGLGPADIAAAGDVHGGAGDGGGGRGGYPQNDHCAYQSISRNGTAGTGNTGGGGGGGAWATRKYAADSQAPAGSGGSRQWAGYAGTGGNGGSGYVTLTGTATPEADIGLPGGGGGLYGGKISSSAAEAGGGSGYVGTDSGINRGSSGTSGNVTNSPGTKDGYGRIYLT